MSKSSKILLVFVIVLIIALAVMTYLYIDMKKTAKENFNAYLEAANKLHEMNSQPNNKGIIDEVKAVTDPEERAELIKVYIENGSLTPDVAKDLY